MTLMWCPEHQVYYKLENKEMAKEHEHCEYRHEIDVEQAIANLSELSSISKLNKWNETE